MASAPVAKPKTARRARVLDSVLWVVGGLGAVALLVAQLTPFELRDSSPWYSAVTWAAFLIRTLAFHAGGFFAQFVLLAVWKRRTAAAGFLSAVMLLALATGWRDLLPARPVAVTAPNMRILSANLFAFSGDHAPLVAEILASDADVLILQEYNAAWHRSLHAALRERYSYQELNPREHCHGIALYSRIQPVEPPDCALILGREGAPQVRVVLPLGPRRIVLYGIHTLPPNSLKYFREQCLQVANLLDRVQRETDAVIIAGDLNFTNASDFSDRFVAAGLSDVHWQAGRGRGATWTRSPRYPWLPGIRIDHIFISRELGCAATIVGTGEGSDHRPVMAEIGFRRPP
jgi:endonuclease/exonuclease/phosphatase (EEP) superfamily protein YafD